MSAMHRIAPVVRQAVLLTAVLVVSPAAMVHANEDHRINLIDPDREPALEALVSEHIEFNLERVKIQRSLIRQRDDGGTRSFMTIQLQIPEHEAFVLHAVRNIDLSATRTSAGEPLRLRNENLHLNAYNQGHATLNLVVDEPREYAETIPELTGTMELYVMRDETRYVAFGPINDISGKSIRLANYQNEAVSIGFHRDGVFALGYTSTLGAFVRPWSGERVNTHSNSAFALYDADRELLSHPSPRWRGQTDDGIGHYVFPDLDPPADGYLELALFAEGGWVTVPFSVRDVPLPMPERRKPRSDESETP